ncbi:hypothetical protein A4X06_0g4038 [Tilletia controversa]|uniref:C2H2-type domain-containing protein n=1 Tax=Tilletia controversa TaxID=13291 RepID=A0A8X7MSZ7_9BASI|nr:hypothetical protein A4X06_0g4038 [Tilletia controversa]
MMPTSSSIVKRRLIFRSQPSSASESDKITWSCSLPPSCHSHPRHFPNLAEYEAHYVLEHAHVCDVALHIDLERAQEGGGGGGGTTCGKVFPSEWLLECHIDESHSDLTEARKARGLPTLHCLHPSCPTVFHSPYDRRTHAIDTHGFPANYFFDLVQHGIGELIGEFGAGASLLLPVGEGEGEGGGGGGGVEVVGDAVTGGKVGPRREGVVAGRRSGPTLKRSRSTLEEAGRRMDEEDDDVDEEKGASPSSSSPPMYTSEDTNDDHPGGDDSNLDQLVDTLDSLRLVPSAVRRKQRASTQQGSPPARMS